MSNFKKFSHPRVSGEPVNVKHKLKYFFILFGFLSASAFAHDLWIEKEGADYILFQGHRYAEHPGEEVIPYPPSAVKAWACINEQGSYPLSSHTPVYPTRVSGECGTVHVTFSTGYWTKTPWETRNIAKAGLTGVVKSWYSQESLKFIQRWIGAAPLGTGLEITPTTNPLLLKPGDKLVVLITNDGKPIAGVPVAYRGDTRGVSGIDGTIAIRLRQSGMQLLEASLEIPLTDGKADVAIHVATSQFFITP